MNRTDLLISIRDSVFDTSALNELIYFGSTYLTTENNAQLIQRYVSRKWNDALQSTDMSNFHFLSETRRLFFHKLNGASSMTDILNVFDDLISNPPMEKSKFIKSLS